MNKIQVLPENIANQIAAGEVIERPVNVMKELLENSLDAEANQIDIQFFAGGISRIQIRDNGCGMDEKSALLCFQRHATSKLQQITDLQTITSFGFRGEALPSIASVAKVTLITRSSANPVGTKTEISADTQPTQTPCPCNIGTTLTVEQLFYNVPVRRKFLKSEATESAHMIQCIRLYALAYPHVHFTLQQDGRLIFSSPACTQFEERMAEIWPKRPQKKWLPLQASQNGWTLSGLLCPPGDGCPHQPEIYLFLNQRPITHLPLIHAIQEAYRGFLSSQWYPAAFLFLSMPGTDVDVNVHPTKKEVRFQQENKVRSFVSEAIRQRLEAVQMQPFGVEHTPASMATKNFEGLEHPLSTPSPSLDDWVSKEASNTSSMIHKKESDVSETRTVTKMHDVTKNEKDISEGSVFSQKELSPSPKQSDPFHLPFFALWNQRLAMFLDDPFLLIFDCKGAQMRLWYNKIVSFLHQGTIGALQTLCVPYTFSLQDTQAVCLKESIDYLNFQKICILHACSDTQFQLEAIPQWLPYEQVDLFVAQLVNSLEQGGQLLALPYRFEPLLQQLLSRKTFAPITHEKQVRALFAELQHCENYITDPLGHPLWNRFTAEDFMRKN